MGHKERYVGSLFRVDEPVPDDSIGTIVWMPYTGIDTVLFEKKMGS